MFCSEAQELLRERHSPSCACYGSVTHLLVRVRGRYNAYKDLMRDAPEVKGIMVAHHIDDIQENVISNVMKGQSILDLNGMAAVSEVNGVSIFRPLLEHDKVP